MLSLRTKTTLKASNGWPACRKARTCSVSGSLPERVREAAFRTAAAIAGAAASCTDRNFDSALRHVKGDRQPRLRFSDTKPTRSGVQLFER